MLQTQCYGSQVSRLKITDKQTDRLTDYYTRGRPRVPRVINMYTSIAIIWVVSMLQLFKGSVYISLVNSLGENSEPTLVPSGNSPLGCPRVCLSCFSCCSLCSSFTWRSWRSVCSSLIFYTSKKSCTSLYTYNFLIFWKRRKTPFKYYPKFVWAIILSFFGLGPPPLPDTYMYL